MFEMRWVNITNTNRHLQFRFIMPCVDASGALCPGDKWSDWKDVPSIDVNDAAYEDLIASGGIRD